ncbi:MAG TPA: tetratricopeptide repeat protein, partial [Nannocystaceae bacterium]|nr:tetratricopeptide repeat protein [Nannocystaceae bacterium]
RPLRRVVAIGAGIVAIAAFAVGRPEAPPLCADDDAGWSSVWSERRNEIAATWSERAGDLGRASFAGVDERLSTYGRDWSAARDHACTLADIEPSGPCLEDRRRRAAALVAAWSDASIDGIASALPALRTLEDPGTCLDVRQRERPGDPGIAAAVAEIDAFVAAGRFVEASALADELAPRLAGARASDVIAARFAAGIARDRAGDWAGAERDLVDALHGAEAQDDHATVVRAAAALVTILGAHLGRLDDGERWRRHAWAALERVDTDDGTLRGLVHAHCGQFAMARGDWRDALAHYHANLEIVGEIQADDDLLRARATADVAGPLVQLGRYDEGIALYEEAIALQRNLLGDHHPSVAMTRHNLANPLGISGQLDRAREEATAALDIWVAAFGERHPNVALARHTLGIICNRTGDLGTAVFQLEKAHALRVELLGPDHADTLATDMNLSISLDRLHRYDEALALLERVADVYARDDAPRPNRGILYINLGDLQRRTGALVESRASLVRALELLRVELGGSHVAVGMALLNLAMTDRELGDGEAAARSFAEAETVMRASVGAHDGRMALVLLERGRLAAREGRAADARADYEAALVALDGTEHTDAERAEIRTALAELDDPRGERR